MKIGADRSESGLSGDPSVSQDHSCLMDSAGKNLRRRKNCSGERVSKQRGTNADLQRFPERSYVYILLNIFKVRWF